MFPKIFLPTFHCVLRESFMKNNCAKCEVQEQQSTWVSRYFNKTFSSLVSYRVF